MRSALRRWLQPGWLAPLVLASWLALDVVLRFLPYAWFNPHPIDLATARPLPHSLFTPNFDRVFHEWEGDAAREANLPPTEQRSSYRISTDSLGFRRNPLARPNKPPDVLFLFGRSLMMGAALSDEETLPAALTRISGLSAYNGVGANNLEDLDWLLERLPGSPSVAVLVLLEDDRLRIPSQHPALPDAPHPAVAPLAPALSLLTGWFSDVEHVALQWWRVSPLKTLSVRLNQSVSNDRILPNEGRLGGRQLQLPNGAPMLFRRYEVLPAQSGRDHEDAIRLADYAEWWRDQLALRGMDTWVLVMPSRYTVYGPWLETGEMRHDILSIEEYIRQIERRIRARGIPVLNALPVYRASVEEQLATGELLFYREDNHWNPRGVEVLAAVLADSLARARSQNRAGPSRTTPPPSAD